MEQDGADNLPFLIPAYQVGVTKMIRQRVEDLRGNSRRKSSRFEGLRQIDKEQNERVPGAFPTSFFEMEEPPERDFVIGQTAAVLTSKAEGL